MNCCRTDVLSPVYESESDGLSTPAAEAARHLTEEAASQGHLPPETGDWRLADDSESDVTGPEDVGSEEDSGEEVFFTASAHRYESTDPQFEAVRPVAAQTEPRQQSSIGQSGSAGMSCKQYDREEEEEDESYLFDRNDIYDNCKLYPSSIIGIYIHQIGADILPRKCV